MKNRRTVTLIYGPTAAGKSTYARKLAADKQAVRFAMDEWMHALYGEDLPEQLNLAWIMARTSRCQSRIWATCLDILACGTDVVLELGLLRTQDRDRMKSVVEEAGYTAAFCFVDASLQVRRQRLLQRNAEQGDTFSFTVTPSMFDAMELYFERPTADELDRSCVVPQECQIA